MSYYQDTYTHQNPAYAGSGEKYTHSDVAIAMNSLPYSHSRPRWSWCSSVCSIFTTFCCLSWCGFVGLLCSVWSYVDHKTADYERSYYKRRWAWGCTIFGIFFSLAIIAAFLVILFVFQKSICDQYTFDLFCQIQTLN